MNRISKIFSFVSILALVAGAATAEVEWSDASWPDIIKQAKAGDKYIVVDFYTTWCGPCKRMDKITYQDEKVIDFLKTTIPVKYDAEEGFGIELAAKHRVKFYPTMIVFNSSGEEVERYAAYLGPEEFIDIIGGYTRGIGTTAFYEKQLKKSPDDPEVLYELGMRYAAAVHPEKAAQCLNRYMELDKAEKYGKREDVLYSLGEASYASDDAPHAREYFETLISDYKDSEMIDRALALLARVEHKTGNPDAAVATYQRIVDRDPDDPGTLNGFAWFCASRRIGLDAALPIALKAAELSGRDPGILDTLAELYYARGEYDKAIEIGKEALASDPEDTYFNNQIKKFKKAKEEANSRASN